MSGNNILDKAAMKMLNEVYVALLGIPGTKDGGCVDRINKMEELLRVQNGSVKTNTTWRKAMICILGGVMTILAFILHAVVLGG